MRAITERLSTGTGLSHVLIPAILAIPIALVIVVFKPSLSLALLFGTFVLVVAFLSPLAGLYLLVFSMLLGPEVLVGSLGTGATLGRGVTLRFDDMLLVLVGLGWLGNMAISEGAGRFLWTPLNRPIMFYIAACVLATLLGSLFGQVRPLAGFFFLLKYYEYFFIYFMVVNIVTDQKQVRYLVMASFVTCFVVTLYALAQIPGGERVAAPFEGENGEPNTLGGYLVFVVGLATGFLVIPGAVSRKLPLWALLGFGVFALQATLSRTSFLAACAVLLGVLESVRRQNAFFLGPLLVGLLLFLVVVPGSVTDRMEHTFTQAPERGQITIGNVHLDTSTSDRLRSWQESLQHFLKSPLWGAGVTGGPFMDAMYPRVLTETGLLGMAAFFYLLWEILKVGMKGYQTVTDPFVRGLSLGFLLGFLGLLVHAIGANTFIIVRIMEPFWLVTALVVRSHMFVTNTEAEENNTEPSIGPALGWRTNQVRRGSPKGRFNDSNPL